MPAVRNILIVLALAAVVAFLPGGGGGASLLGSILSTLIICAFVVLFARFYREHRMDIRLLGDRWRAILYAAMGLIVLALAGAGRLFETGLGTLVWLIAMGGAAYMLFLCWRQYREYA